MESPLGDVKTQLPSLKEVLPDPSSASRIFYSYIIITLKTLQNHLLPCWGLPEILKDATLRQIILHFAAEEKPKAIILEFLKYSASGETYYHQRECIKLIYHGYISPWCRWVAWIVQASLSSHTPGYQPETQLNFIYPILLSSWVCGR